MDSDELVPDGERYMPVFQGIIRLEHYHRYHAAASLCAEKDVLDIASGEGFGSALLARSAKNVVGVDISDAAVRHASRSYSADNLEFRTGSATAIPLKDDAVDVAVSFETIEHLAEHDEMLAELHRVLRPGGLLFLSSPNKTEYSDKTGYKNPFHVRELYTDDLLRLVGRHFKTSRHYGQRVTAASVIASANSTALFRNYRHNAAESAVIDAMYDLVLASDGALPDLEHSIFEEIDSPLQPLSVEAGRRDLEQLQSIQDELNAFRADVGEQISQRVHLEAEIGRLRVALAEAEAYSSEARELSAQIAQLDLMIRSRDKVISNYEKALSAVVSDANRLIGDKWWRRTNVFRRASNSIRKLRGKPKKNWPRSFQELQYLGNDPEPTEDLVKTDRARSVGRDPVSGHDYAPAIDVIEFSDIPEYHVTFKDRAPVKTCPRTIAFYLPQYHPFPENDDWWGKGFTEWTNVGKAKPLFKGHHQPHCPIHLGYYDLRLPEVMEEQARMARAYGVNGFAYYFYWFAGKILMSQPLETMLANPQVDIPFCFIWANENWTRRWDGMENDILIGQKHSLDDSRKLLTYLRKFFDDPRYITIDGKPLFIVYRPGIIPDIAETLDMWREEAKAMGFPGLYLVSSQTFGHRDPREYGFDAAMDFPPHTARSEDVRFSVSHLDPQFEGQILDYEQVVGHAVTRPADEYKVFPTAMLSWDNTARKGVRAHVFTNFSVTRYGQWLASNAERVVKDRRYSDDEKLVFVNAWNEWAEGTHLEPDQKHGFGYLEATRRVMSQFGTDAAPFLDPEMPGQRRSDVALILHLHFLDLWHELAEAIRELGPDAVDIYATATSVEAAQAIAADFPKAYVELVDNRGRDIRPFLSMFGKLRPLGYSAIGKVHGKKSSYRADGDALRQSAYAALLTTESMERIRSESKTGLLAPAASLIPHTDKNMTYSGVLTREIAKAIGVRFEMGRFPAGSMFWFRPKALDPLLKVGTHEFDVERGLVDGTRAHAIERLFCAVCESCGYDVKEIG